MIEHLQHKIDALKRFKNSKGELMRRLITEFDYIIIDMNVQDQLYERGITSTGQSIASYAPYSPVTRMFKTMKMQPVDRVTLRDTGAFHKSFTVEATEFDFRIVPKDIKTEMLQRSYGDDIIGLTEENLNELMHEYIFPEMLNILKEWLEN